MSLQDLIRLQGKPVFKILFRDLNFKTAFENCHDEKFKCLLCQVTLKQFVYKRIHNKESFPDDFYATFLIDYPELNYHNIKKSREEFEFAFSVIEDKDDFRIKYNLVESLYDQGRVHLIDTILVNAKKVHLHELVSLFGHSWFEVQSDIRRLFFLVDDFSTTTTKFLSDIFSNIDVDLEVLEHMDKGGFNFDISQDFIVQIIFKCDLNCIIFLYNKGFIQYGIIECIENFYETRIPPNNKRFIQNKLRRSVSLLQFKTTDCIYKPGGIGYLKAKDNFMLLCRK